MTSAPAHDVAAASETDPEEIVAIQGKPWWVLQDAGGDIVALCERPAPVSGVEQPARVAQYLAYEPYGAVIEAHTLHPHPPLHAGHKGLFADRLDAGLADSGGNELPRLVPLADITYYVRNRTYSPRHGRWLQQDPNATGMVIAGTIASMGRGMDAAPSPMMLGQVFTDGANLYGYLRFSPLTGGDPLGLYEDDGGYDGLDLYNDATAALGLLSPVPGLGDMITGAYRALVEEYSANLEWDVDWATDWDQADDWHTRGDSTWVLLALGRGLHEAFDINLPFSDITVNPLGPYGSSASLPGDNGGLTNVLKKGQQWHHIATKDGAYRARMEDVFRRAGMTLDDPANLLRIPHSGRHNKEYHLFVLKRIKSASDGLDEKAARRALRAELRKLGDFIRKNPHFLYNTSGGKRTGWRGMRDFVKLDRGRYRYRR